MLAKRIIPCLDVRDGMVVKGTRFQDIKTVDNPVELGKWYSQQGADELVFYDITASAERRRAFLDVVSDIAKMLQIPFTVGGGIRSLEDFSKALHAGADKISINSAAVENPHLITDAASRYGAQCVVLSMDVKREGSSWRVFTHGGRKPTELNAVEWAKRGVAMGAGEIVVNSIDQDGVRNGYDLALIQAVTAAVSVPVIASGGAGTPADFLNAFVKGNADGALAASVFHYRQIQIPALKTWLRQNGVPMRID